MLVCSVALMEIYIVHRRRRDIRMTDKMRRVHCIFEILGILIIVALPM